jgi:glycosyltransferase involved in cell wall biosynthesis
MKPSYRNSSLPMPRRLFSLIIPSWNSELYISECIGSLVSQRDWIHEILVVDGMSTDTTADIVDSYHSSLPMLKLIQEYDRGQCDAMNKGLAMASGTIIGFLNSDDFLFPGCLQEVANCFSSSRPIDMVIGGYTIFSNGSHRYNAPSNSLISLYDFSTFRWPINPVAYFCTKSLHNRIGYFPENVPITMDYWFLLRAFHYAKCIQTVDRIFGCFRIHESNKSQVSQDVRRSMLNCREDFVRSTTSKKAYTVNLMVRLLESSREFLQRLRHIRRRLLMYMHYNTTSQV